MMWTFRFLLIVTVWTIGLLSLERAFAKEYQPDTREALLFRPERPVERVQPSTPCLTPPERPKRVMWLLRDESGNVIIIGTRTIRERC